MNSHLGVDCLQFLHWFLVFVFQNLHFCPIKISKKSDSLQFRKTKTYIIANQDFNKVDFLENRKTRF